MAGEDRDVGDDGLEELEGGGGEQGGAGGGEKGDEGVAAHAELVAFLHEGGEELDVIGFVLEGVGWCGGA